VLHTKNYATEFGVYLSDKNLKKGTRYATKLFTGTEKIVIIKINMHALCVVFVYRKVGFLGLPEHKESFYDK
jgi:hypothetical protein